MPAGVGNLAGDCHGCASKYTGAADGTCAPVKAGTICRNYGSTFCDLRELCDGTGLACPDDLGRRAGLACNKNTNVPAEVGTGVCPAAGAPGTVRGFARGHGPPEPTAEVRIALSWDD